MRVVIFGSYYRGFYVLDECLFGPLASRIRVVGVASDDPTANFISRRKRVWQYPYTSAEAKLVPDLAERHGVPVFQGRVKDDSFRRLFMEEWAPDLCIAATFGQLIDKALFTFPAMGFFNLHPYDGEAWPSAYAGANPFAEMINDEVRRCVIGMHHVDESFDTGALIGKSNRIAIPPGASVSDMHKLTSPVAAILVRNEINRILKSCDGASTVADVSRMGLGDKDRKLA